MIYSRYIFVFQMFNFKLYTFYTRIAFDRKNQAKAPNKINIWSHLTHMRRGEGAKRYPHRYVNGVCSAFRALINGCASGPKGENVRD